MRETGFGFVRTTASTVRGTTVYIESKLAEVYGFKIENSWNTSNGQDRQNEVFRVKRGNETVAECDSLAGVDGWLKGYEYLAVRMSEYSK